ncbi:hypothetical protein H5410_004085 [Solanum commersonii]|uniref:Uncharacterized protein n=1 Tax=Solanum commersonii TaxID=4109 RepID=A0A9J6B6R6_SOLCO|nr:hypothetical protein H5410_004085 [Solanum commersonii]
MEWLEMNNSIGRDFKISFFESGGTSDHDLTLKDNDKGGWTEVPSKKISPGGTKIQQLDFCNPTHKDQMVNCEDKVSQKAVCSNTFDVLMINSDQELHVLSTPILLVSNPETPKIIKEPEVAMLNIANPTVKSPMATINTSDNNVVVEEEEHISSPSMSKLSPKAPIFVPSSKANPSMAVTIDKSKKILTITTKVLEKINEPTTTYHSDLGSKMFDKDDKADMLNLLFDKVAKDGNLSPRKYRSGRNKSRNKTHERQHSWDGKVT